jgi:hypothetical protein
MATEVCTEECCRGHFEPEYISVEVTLRGHLGKDQPLNGAVSYMSTRENLTVEHQREIANKIAKILGVKPYHAV